MAPHKLKVFQAQFGFYDTVVAAPSQTAALRAWGTRQNLFASGDAKATTEASAVAAALEHPGVPLRRAVGSGAAFELEPKGLPKVPTVLKPTAKKVVATPPQAPAKPPPDRTSLDAAEQALGALEEERRREEARLRRRQDDLDAETAEAQSSYVRRRKAVMVALEAAKSAYRRAGGRD